MVTTVESLRTLMSVTTSKLPEYRVMAMKGVYPSLGSQLMAEIGDISRLIPVSPTKILLPHLQV